tara:strand:+ start:105 stop:1172 length:1068 start_codon:yes stop_codon:yes gene_type:complete
MLIRLISLILFVCAYNILFAQTAFFCASDSIQNFNVLLSQNSTYNWEFLSGDSQIINGNGTENIEVVLRGEGGFVLRVTEIDTNGCEGYTDLNIYIYPEPDFSFDLIGNCEGNEAVFFNTSYSADSIVSYNWDFGDGGFSTNISPSHIYNNVGSYNVNINVYTLNGCYSSFDTIINVFHLLEASFGAFPQNTTILESEVNFINYSIGDINLYNWDFGDGFYSNIQNPIHIYDSIGYFDVELIVTDVNQCQDSAFSQIIIKPDFTFYIPEAFTPNEDGINDDFGPHGMLSYIQAYNMKIFDQWGSLIFESNDYNHKWNGYDFTQNKVPLDAYVWRIYIEDYLGKVHLFNGKVILAR